MTHYIVTKLNRWQTPWFATLAFIIVISLLHLLIAGRAGLTVDGAHYALYARHLALSYYDHPPMVGWLQSFILPISHTDFAMRIMPITLSALYLIVLYRLSIDLFPNTHPWFGFYTVVASQIALLLHFMPFLMLPQEPLILFSLLSILFLYHAVKSNKLVMWIGFGSCLGLSCLSEYTAVIVGFAAFIYIIVTSPKQFKRYGPWLALVITCLFASPVFIWNAQHNWISFLYQIHHGTSGDHWHISKFVVSQLIQLLVYTPSIYILGWWIILYNGLKLKYLKETGSRLLFIVATSILVFFACASGYNRTLPHWTALAWIVMIPLIIQWVYQHRRSLMIKRTIVFSFIFVIILGSIMYSELFKPWIPFPNYKNPLVDLYGWNQAANIAKQELKKMCENKNSDLANCSFKLFVPNWTLASRLSWYSELAVQIATNRPGINQFSLWYGKPQNGAAGILVVPHRWGNPPKTGDYGEFENCKQTRLLTIKRDDKIIQQFYYYICYNFKKTIENYS